MVSAPQTREEFEARFAANHRVSGYGMDVTVHQPCPFCGAPDFLTYRILETHKALAAFTVCGECGRGMRAIVDAGPYGTSFEFVQTAGDDPPPWAPMRRDPMRVDRSAVTLTDGSPVTPDHQEIEPESGMQKGYVVLSTEERAKGFVRPVRRSYKHLECGTVTTMGQALAETYARDPKFYGATFCAGCRAHFQVGPDGEFDWYPDGGKVGT
jgi:hypothetical protein